jgi:N-acetyl-anhydromuramyl-L-alanine amidase AmpD
VGHEHVAPGRKADPGAAFDWPRLSALLQRQRSVKVFSSRDFPQHGTLAVVP